MTTEASKHPVDDLLDDIEVRIEALEKIFKEDLNEGVARAPSYTYRGKHQRFRRDPSKLVFLKPSLKSINTVHLDVTRAT